jgi:methylamine dehydrogenase accessory protein MauD
MMELLIASNVLLWIVCIALALINYALIRQIGVLYERIAPAGALAINKARTAGEDAPEHQIESLNLGLIHIGGQDQDAGRSKLLFFLSPDCPVCKTLLPMLKSIAKAEASWLDLILASDGDEHDHHAYLARYKLHSFPYIVSEALGRGYGVNRLPYAVLINELGKIAALGIVNSREHLESLFEAKEREVASLQQYLNSKPLNKRESVAQ